MEQTLAQRSRKFGLGRGLTHRATNSADAPEDEEAVLVARDKRGDQAKDSEEEEAGLEDDLGGEEIR